jgi:Flp pilus assembly protein TadD
MTLRAAHGLWDVWFKPGATCQYYPLSFTGFWLGYQLWGFNTLGFHLLNVALHCTAAILLWQLLKRLQAPGAWLAGGLFALHPVCVMSVAWMTELKNTLSATLALAAAWAYIRGMKLGVYREPEGGNRPWSMDRKFYALSLGFFVLAMTAKTAVSFLPATLLLVTWWQGRKLNWRSVWPVLPMLGIAVGMGMVTMYIERGQGGANGAHFVLPFVSRVLISGRSFWFYLGKLFFPYHLTFIYERWRADAGSWWQWLYVAGTAALLGGSWLASKRIGRGVFAGLGHFYISTSLLILFLVLYFTTFSYVSDHWQYFGCTSVLALVAAGFVRALDRLAGPRAKWKPAAAGGLLLALGVMTWQQCQMYKDRATLWSVTLERNPDCAMANNWYAGTLFQQGKIDEAITHLRTAIRTEPDNFEAHNNLGNALVTTGHFDEAVSELQRAGEIEPDSAVIRTNLSDVAFLRGVWKLATSLDDSARNGARAVEMAEQADRASGGRNSVVLGCLGAAYAEAGRYAEAVQTVQKALRTKAAQADSGLSEALQGQLAEYEAGRPVRDGSQVGPAARPLSR